MPASRAWPRRSLRAIVTCAAVLASPSCTVSSWKPVANPAPGALPPDARLQVWRGGRSVTLREVSIDADSIRGREVVSLGAFSRARLAIARSEVDSLREAPRDKDNWFGAGVGLGVVGAVVFPYLLRVLGPRGT
jgi:hypothetical protein